jgi:long-chain fatty acid transport protein
LPSGRSRLVSLVLLALLCPAPPADARPYPGLSGLAATADSAATAGSNPAGITRFDERAWEVELMWFNSESEWEGGIDGSSDTSVSTSSGDTVIPRIFYLQPINEQFAFSFTVLGAGFSDDLGNWPGRYFVQEYDALYVSAFPSLAYEINERWSVAGSLALTYASYRQERAVANLFDPGFGDGRSEIETDSIEFGFGLSTLYEASDRTRWGLTYNSEIDTTQEGDNDLSGLGPRTEAVMQRLGLIGVDIEVQSTSPQSVILGLYHEFPNDHAITLDGAWIDFSSFRLSEFYFDGEAFTESDAAYNDIYALAASYTWPVADRWMLGVGGLVTSQLIDDEDRTMTLRLDAIWSAGVAAEWQWRDDYRLKFSVSYMNFGDAPVTSDPIPGIGSYAGEYVDRDTILLQIGVKYDGL